MPDSIKSQRLPVPHLLCSLQVLGDLHCTGTGRGGGAGDGAEGEEARSQVKARSLKA